jgi:hypothetical protein
MTVVGQSSIKRLENDGLVVLNNGRQAKLIVSGNEQSCPNRTEGKQGIKRSCLGSKGTCVEQWNREMTSTTGQIAMSYFPRTVFVCLLDDIDDESEADVDDLSSSMDQTVQAPTNAFSTRK